MTALLGKKAFVTGATSGIGRATALCLRRAGAYVVGTGRQAANLQALAQTLGPNGEATPLDVSRPEAVADVMTQFKQKHRKLEILVVNAGISTVPPIAELTSAAYDQIMDVNCRGAVFTFVHALPLLADGASVIFIGSVAGGKGQPGSPLYAGSKGFIRAFARSAGTDPDLMRRRIRVNVVAPGPIETPMVVAATSDPDIRAYVETLIPMHRWGKPEEVAEAVLFLASDASSFMTGAELTVDGGMAHA